MKKRTYKQPSIEVVVATCTTILATSSFDINETEVNDQKPPNVSDDIWNKQW